METAKVLETSNTISKDISKTEAYRERMASFLGNRDPLDVLESTPEILGTVIRKHEAKVLQKRPFQDKWTPNEILGHLMDVEWTLGFRIRTVYCDEHPKLMPMNQEEWVRIQKHNERNPEELVTAFAALRMVNLSFWRSVDPSRFGRTGLHAERGEESLAQILRIHAGHDLSHIDQIERYLKAIRN